MLSSKLYLFILKVLYRISGKIYFLDLIQNVKRNNLAKKNVHFGHNSLILDCIFSSSGKGDEFFIGDNCTCTGASFLGHDASPTLFLNELQTGKPVYHPGSRFSYRKPIRIENNVFIGHRAIVLPGVNVCSNVVIAAGSVVTKSITSSGVYGGNPARKITDIDTYKKKYENLLETNPECF